jgi:hypothetical protein
MTSLTLVPNDIESELHSILDTNQSVHRRRRFYFKVTAIDRKLTERPQIIARYGYLRRNGDRSRHAM